MENLIVPFGKYKGQQIDSLLNDSKFRSYCEWAINQQNIRENYPDFYQIVVNFYFPPNDNTPEHNALQNRLLDYKYCLAIGKLCNWKLMSKKSCILNLGKEVRITKELPYRNEYERDKINDKLENLKYFMDLIDCIIEVDGVEILDGKPFFKMAKSVEDGWDIIIKTDDSYCKLEECAALNNCSINNRKIAIEIKTSLGDDYPKILRQMKSILLL